MNYRFVIIESINKLGTIRLKMIHYEDLDSVMEYNEKCGFKVNTIKKYYNLSEFLNDGLDWVKERACNKENEPTCADLIYYGSICDDIIRFMAEYDIDWLDLCRSGELYICLQIFNQNANKCILMKGGVDNA